MKRKSKIQIVEVLSEYSQEMLATSGYNLNSPLRGSKDNPCKTELILHLKSGDKITLSNRHEECTKTQKWCGDEITNVCDLIPELWHEVDYLDVVIKSGNRKTRMRIPLECVAWVELYQEPKNE